MEITPYVEKGEEIPWEDQRNLHQKTELMSGFNVLRDVPGTPSNDQLMKLADRYPAMPYWYDEED